MMQYYSAGKKHEIYSHIDVSVNYNIECSDQSQKEKCQMSFLFMVSGFKSSGVSTQSRITLETRKLKMDNWYQTLVRGIAEYWKQEGTNWGNGEMGC